jgi:rare lipoprotein A (peptidoglycan hydrolase)
MKTIIKNLFFITLSIVLLSFDNKSEHHCKATWYDTAPHPRVHRSYSTAAFNIYPKGTYLSVTNKTNGKVDTVMITDIHGKGINHIDLSLNSFKKIANPKVGVINVVVKKL